MRRQQIFAWPQLIQPELSSSNARLLFSRFTGADRLRKRSFDGGTPMFSPLRDDELF